MGWLKKPMRCEGERSMLGRVMQHAAVTVALRCADGGNNFGIRFHRFRHSFPRNLSPASINSGIRSHQFGFPLPQIFSFLSMESVSLFHEFTFSLSRILTLFSTNVGKQKRHPFVGMSFSIAFPLSGGAWRIRTAVDGFADR